MKQISFWEVEAEQLLTGLVPKFERGDDIFVLSLDVVQKGKVSYCFICGDDAAPYYGYSVDFQNGMHTVTWDMEIGDRTFSALVPAQNRAAEISRTLTKIAPQELKFVDKCGFEYTRNHDNYLLTAGLAKVGKDRLYEHNFMCYHFLRNFKSEKKRDEEYNRLLRDMESECVKREGKRSEFKPIILYKSVQGIYASRGYVEHEGAHVRA